MRSTSSVLPVDGPGLDEPGRAHVPHRTRYLRRVQTGAQAYVALAGRAFTQRLEYPAKAGTRGSETLRLFLLDRARELDPGIRLPEEQRATDDASFLDLARRVARAQSHSWRRG